MLHDQGIISVDLYLNISFLVHKYKKTISMENKRRDHVSISMSIIIRQFLYRELRELRNTLELYIH